MFSRCMSLEYKQQGINIVPKKRNSDSLLKTKTNFVLYSLKKKKKQSSVDDKKCFIQNMQLIIKELYDGTFS